jgi:translation initiation factor IF-2
MDKIKIHELAKQLEVTSKEVLGVAIELGADVKNHMSSVDEKMVEKIKIKLNKNKKENKEVKEKKKEEDAPVIIRREVIVEDEKEQKNIIQKKDKEVGKVVERKNKNFNIVYRNKPIKPMTASELFGLNKKKEEKKPEPEIKTAEKEETSEKVVVPLEKEKEKDLKKNNETEKEDVKKEEIMQEVKDNKIVNNRRIEKNNNQVDNKNNSNQISNQNNYTNYSNRNNYDRNSSGNNKYQNNNYKNNNYQDRNNGNRNKFQQKGFNRNNNEYQNGNSEKNNNGNRFQPRNNFNRNGNYQDRNNNQGYGNRNGYRNQNNNRPLDEKGIEKNIKNIMETEFVEKEVTREYNKNNYNKQKNARQDETKNKKNNKSRRNDMDENFDSGKLKDLKQTNRLSNMFDDQDGGMLDYYDMSKRRDKKNKKKNNQQQEERNKQRIFELTEITIPESITVKDLATEMKKTAGDVIKKLLNYGIMATINNDIDFDTAYLVAGEFGITAKKKEVVTDEEILFDDSEDKPEDLQTRPPVIVVMGHVDHGKTSLLDAIRQTNVIEGEAGGITQKIGAYKVEINGREITFLDTPGHEAFTSMRARGAQVTDIAILVVAANDGVMPQTVEAIDHAKSAGIPIIVAINKIDVPGANPQKVKEELMKYELVPEEWGGNTVFVEISAKKRINIDGLLEMVLLVADMQELKANPNKQSKGVVIEARLDKTKGPVATMLVQRGTLDTGDTIVVGSVIGKVRAMTNEHGKKVKKAGPSTPVEILGLTEVPEAGEIFYEVNDEKTAKHLVEKRKRQAREKSINSMSRMSLNDLFSQIERGKLKELNLIVKADLQGSVEAVKSSLEKLSNDEVKVKVVHANVGGVTETDVTLAKVTNAIIIAFNVRPEALAKVAAEKEEIEIKTYSVIYHAIDDVKDAMTGMLDPKYEEKIIGNAEVRQIFKVSSIGTIGGCYVTNGKIERHAGVRVIRDNVVIHDGKLASLKRFKDDVKEVTEGYECGLQIENYNDIKQQDLLEIYIMQETKRTLK